MIVKAARVTVVVIVAICALGTVDRGEAAPIPEYFSDEWVGFACLSATRPGASATPVLVQLNFDKLAGGGLSLARADTVFGRMTGSLGWLGQLIGASLQV